MPLLAKPDSIVFGANIGAPSHFAGLMLEQQKPGAVFRYTQTGGGAKRIAAIQGEHVDATSFSIAEFVQYRGGGLRALAVLGEQRHPKIPNVPTATEQGFQVVSENTQFWWAPPETPQPRIDVLADAIETAMQMDDVQEKLALMNIDPVVMRGQTLAEDLERRAKSISEVSQRPTIDLPNIPLITLVITVCFAMVSFARREIGFPIAASKGDLELSRMNLVGAIAAITIAYVLLLQIGFSFVPCTIVFLICAGVVILRQSSSQTAEANRETIEESDTTSVAAPITNDPSLAGVGWRRSIASLTVFAFVFAFAIQYLFTEVLVVDLP